MCNSFCMVYFDMLLMLLPETSGVLGLLGDVAGHLCVLQAFLSRLLLMLGSFVIMCLLLF